jgi:hypothetical protein
VRCESLPNEFEVPVRTRHRLLIASNAGPERLHVVDLLRDREIIETRRRHRERLTHEPSVSKDRPVASQEPRGEAALVLLSSRLPNGFGVQLQRPATGASGCADRGPRRLPQTTTASRAANPDAVSCERGPSSAASPSWAAHRSSATTGLERASSTVAKSLLLIVPEEIPIIAA